MSGLALGLALLAGCSKPAADSGRSPPPQRDLIMISIDTLRRDSVGRYDGSDRTPFLDSLLAQGLTLDAHHACSNWTYGSILCGLGGADGVDVGWVPYATDPPIAIPGDIDLLPGQLQKQGFRVGLVSTNGYLGYTSKLSRYYDLFDNQELGSAEIVVDNGLAMLEDLIGAERWFLHLHFFDPHSPYAPPEAYLGGLEGLAPIDYDLSQFAGVQELEGAWKDLGDEERELVLEHLRVRYEGSIAYLDDELERLWEGLEAAGALDEALVVIWSDHGEQFYEYGELEHGKSMHGVEVDTFVSFLGPNVAAQAWGEHTTHGDISPTIFEHLGLEPRQWEPASDLGGVGAVVGSADPGRPRFAVKRQGEETLHSVDLDGWRLIYTWEGEFGLYDLERDPGEVENLYEEEPGRAAELWAVLAPRVEALAAETEEAQPNLP